MLQVYVVMQQSAEHWCACSSSTIHSSTPCMIDACHAFDHGMVLLLTLEVFADLYLIKCIVHSVQLV